MFLERWQKVVATFDYRNRNFFAWFTRLPPPTSGVLSAAVQLLFDLNHFNPSKIISTSPLEVGDKNIFNKILDIEPLVRSWKTRYNILQHNTTYTPSFLEHFGSKRSLKGNKLNYPTNLALSVSKLGSDLPSILLGCDPQVWHCHVKIDINRY